MIWLLLYLMGVIVTICALGFLTRGEKLSENDYGPIFGITTFWPLFAAIAMVVGVFAIPFMLCRGDFDKEISGALRWCKTTWESLGD